MRDPFWITAEAQPKYEYPLSWRLICRKGSLLGPVVGEDQKQVRNPLHVALPKREMGLILGNVIGDSLRCQKELN